MPPSKFQRIFLLISSWASIIFGYMVVAESNILTVPSIDKIADSVNSESFLRELVALKAAENVEYKSRLLISDANNKCSSLQTQSECIASGIYSVKDHSSFCEYTGKLWFLRASGTKFRESMIVKDVDMQTHHATIECNSDYFSGKKWVECSKVVVNVDFGPSYNPGAIGNNNNREGLIKLNIKSDLLVRIPVPGVTGKVNKMISSTFKDALTSFFKSHHGVGPEQLAFV